MNLNWNRLRAINGSQREGFEELVAQLARVETPADARFERVGAPDAGVECYCVLDGGGEWAWQAKYFTSSLTNNQWGQLDDSIEKALDKHPELARYFVCIPWDRPDARRSDQTSAMQRWNDHVAKWEAWAHGKGMDVEFVWWGASELLERLSREEHIGRVFFWFQEQYFSEKWYGDRLDEAIKSAGPRYTPELHVDLPIVLDLEMFGRVDSAFNRIKALARDIRRDFGHVSLSKEDQDRLHQNIDLTELMQSRAVVLDSFSNLESAPAGELQLAGISEKIEAAEGLTDQSLKTLDTLLRENRLRSDKPDNLYDRRNPVRGVYSRVARLQYTFQEIREEIRRADELANGRVMILKGRAGAGKTHLLCDVARRRLDDAAPTVLLMGQRFTDSSEPWVQALQQLDMGDAKAEQFIGALECSAQVANCRALLIIDALNEGRGREIWPPNLPAFLAHVENSPWVDVVLSVRSSYEEEVIPADVRETAITIAHEGFEGHEYDALRTFSEHYRIEFPSTPILQPEFSNPLFLKIICEGLKAKGERRIPRGSNGVTAVFDLYIDSVNGRLATSLDYNPNDNLVRQALDKVAGRMIDAESNLRWLPRQQAERAVNELLPGLGYSNSLYRGLVVEGLLTEEGRAYTGADKEVVRFAYDRFSDHIIVDFLLRKHLDPNNPKVAFAEGGGLSFLGDKNIHVPYGILEAMFVQVPERTKQELLRLAPSLMDNPNIGAEFLSSIIWRNPAAISRDTLLVLGELEKQKYLEGDEILDTILTVSTIPGHRLNAEFLDDRLRKDTMPERDAWWSIYLHNAWEDDKGPVHRLVDWASGLSAADDIVDEVVDISTTTLAWMLTTSNRFLRDKATKALVCLLTDRFDAVVRMVNRFDNVDDPYVRERVYAVAYAVAMRSSDASQVEKVGHAVYENIFASGSPPTHIFLRDYAMGVVQRALHLSPSICIDRDLIRTPLKSDWPVIPEEEDLEGLTPHWNDGEGNWGTREWARNRIRWSVMDDDFARYVIGMNSGSRSSRWLALSLDEEAWQSSDERLQSLLEDMNEEERLAYDEFQRAEYERFSGEVVIEFEEFEGSFDTSEGTCESGLRFDDETEQDIQSDRAWLLSTLTEEHRLEMELIWQSNEPLGFDLSLVQRYILGRVFELGWTVERFGDFDSFTIGDSGRDATKAERIGKKYQWIAYHEILACLADSYQYRPWEGASERVFLGPWQDSYPYRDIDPSCTLPATVGGTGWSEHNFSWWARAVYDDWQEDASHQAWLETENDVPNIEGLLRVSRASDEDKWLVAEGHYTWRQGQPADLEPYGNPRREFWMMCHGYFIRCEDVDKFGRWAKSVDFSGRWMPEPPNVYPFEMYLGEYIWSPAFEHLTKSYESSTQDEIWVDHNPKCPVATRTTAFSYRAEAGGFDCSVDDSYGLYIPHADFVLKGGLVWSGSGADFANGQGEVVAFDPTVHEDGPSTLLLREDLLLEYLQKEQLAICWVIIGEKQIIGERDARNRHKIHKLSGAYALSESGLDGFINWTGTI